MSKTREDEEPISFPGLGGENGLDIVNTPQEGLPDVRTQKPAKYKRSGHLTDQMLKSESPKKKGEQLPLLFDLLEPETKRAIQEKGIESSAVVEGIKLNPSEQKIIDCLTKLLHEKSQNFKTESDDYFTGNIAPKTVDYSGVLERAPVLGLSIYELTKEYKAGDYVSGKDIENVTTVLRDLEEKKFLLNYKEVLFKPNGGRTEREVQGFYSLIRILKLSESEYDASGERVSGKQDLLIMLNPIFRNQIESKFILYPSDLLRRTIIAYGSHNLSETALRLRDYLLREFSQKRYVHEIGLNNLYWKLNDKWMKESRKKKVKEYTEKAIKTAKSLGLLESYEIKEGKKDAKIVFTLNKDWE